MALAAVETENFELSRMTDVEHIFLRANGINFHVVQMEQDAPLILFLHGFPECWYSWRHQLPAMAKAGFRAWAPDLRGYNLSSKPLGVDAYQLGVLALDVEELLNAAGVEKAIIAGHDWGGLIAWQFAMDYPERISRLVIMNAPHPARQRAGFFMLRQWLKSWYIAAFQLPYLPEMILTRDPRATAEGLRSSAVRREAFADADLEIYRRAIAQPGAMHAAVNYYRALARAGFWLPIKPIDAPTLMIWGEDDIALGKELAYAPERWVRNFRLLLIPHCGHWVQNEAADEVNDVMLEFLR